MVFVGVEDIDPLSCLYVQDELSVEDASRIVWEAVGHCRRKAGRFSRNVMRVCPMRRSLQA